jgi:hypothetical protein
VTDAGGAEAIVNVLVAPEVVEAFAELPTVPPIFKKAAEERDNVSEVLLLTCKEKLLATAVSFGFKEIK